MKSYIKDTTDFINKLESIDPLAKGAFLVMKDIASLYINISHNEGIDAVAKFLEVNDSTKVILKFLSLIPKQNNFTFNDVNILQIKGCAMGSKFSRLYAAIFVGNLEKELIYPLITNKHLCYYRFVDHIFVLLPFCRRHLDGLDRKLTRTKQFLRQTEFSRPNHQICM